MGDDPRLKRNPPYRIIEYEVCYADLTPETVSLLLAGLNQLLKSVTTLKPCLMQKKGDFQFLLHPLALMISANQTLYK